MKPIKTIFLTRHGATEYNEKDLLQGLLDIALSKKGVRQAELLAGRLRQESIDLIFYSPLIRAKQTAEIINQYHNVTMKPVPAFTEIDMGDWEGLNFAQIIKEKPKIYQKWLIDPESQVPGGESFSQVFTRVKPGVAEILNTKEKSILIVAHAMVNRAILGNILDMKVLSARRFRTSNCALSRLSVYKTEDGEYIGVDSWNGTEHLNTD